jgi:hypothetical protein
VVTGLDSAVERQLLEKHTGSVFAAFDHDADGAVNRTEWVDTLLWHGLQELLCKVQPGSGPKVVVLPGACAVYSRTRPSAHAAASDGLQTSRHRPCTTLPAADGPHMLLLLQLRRLANRNVIV